MQSTFEETPLRQGSGSLKWDIYSKQDVLPFWVADMDFKSPPEVIEALQVRASHGVFGYTLPTTDEKTAVLEYLRRRHGYMGDGNALVWLPGMVPALTMASAVAKSRGASAAMTCTPVYPPFLNGPKDVGLEVCSVPLMKDPTSDGRMTFDFVAMEKSVDAKTGLFILCNPHNPVGRAYSKEELSQLVAFCDVHELLLCSDEIHCDLILDEAKTPHHSLLGFDGEIQERAIVLMAASKTYNIAGIGCAFAIIPNMRLRHAFRKVKGGWIPPVNAFGYTATAAALRHGDAWRQSLLAHLRVNEQILRCYLKEHHPEIVMSPTEGTYLAWLDVRALELENAHAFFQKRGVGLSDGLDFGAPGFLRWNFGCSRSLLEKGLRRFTRALNE